MSNVENKMERVAYYSLVLVALAVFTSISVAAGQHILLVIPALYFLYKKPSAWSLSMLAVAAISVSILLSVVFNWNDLERPLKNLGSIKYFLIPLIGVFAYRNIEWTPKRISIALHSLIIATTVASLCGLIGLYTGYTPLKFKAACHTERACGLYGMYMTYGYGISLFMILLSGALIYRDKLSAFISTKILAIAWIINLLGLYFSFARGALIGFLLALPFFFLKKNMKKFTLAFAGIIVIFGVTFLGSESVRKMFTERATSNQQRIAFFETALKAFQEKPIVGWGYKNFEPNVKAIKAKYEIAFPDFQGHAHNNFLEHLASTGIIGLLAMLFFHVAWFKESLCSNRVIDHIALPFIVGLSVSGLTQVTLGDGENLFLIMTFWSLCQVKKVEPV